MMLNCLNGTIDLTTGKLQPHKQEDYLTKLCQVKFDPAAECPVFLKTINGIFKGDVAFIGYVQRFQGYCLTGNVKEDSIAIAYGGGSNGKSKFFGTIIDVMGPDYAGTIPDELLTETKSNQHPCIKADLFGKRFMVAPETAEGSRLNEKRVKSLTGGDRIKARGMNENFWEFVPTHKIIIMTNHKPVVRGNDEGIWRRIALWPFTVRFWDPDKGENGPPELIADKTIPEKLAAEHGGILAWLVKGCVNWQTQGMKMPATVQEATKAYRSAEDQVGAFIDAQCKVHSECRVKVKDLYAAFKAWFEDNGEGEISGKAFGEAMTDKGFSKDHGKRWYIGLALTTEEDAKNPEKTEAGI